MVFIGCPGIKKQIKDEEHHNHINNLIDLYNQGCDVRERLYTSIEDNSEDNSPKLVYLHEHMVSMVVVV